MIYLRSYQKDILKQTLNAIENNINPLIQLDTGAGKTPIIAELCKNFDSFVVITHRNFLVKQASETLSKMRVEHDVLAGNCTRNNCIVLAVKYNSSLIFSTSKLVASVDTLLSRKKRSVLKFDVFKKWIVIIDEAHHALDDNKWGVLKKLLKNAIFVGLTATPIRADNRSLNANSGGLFDCIIQSNDLKENSIRTLINNGYLSDFKCYYHKIKNDNFIDPNLNNYVIGEYIKSYKRLSKNKRAIVMCKSIKEAESIAYEFKKNGFSAVCISSKMTQSTVSRMIEEFSNGQIKILCNVAMVDEGFDVPDAECLIMLRNTNFRNYRQWVGRVLRPKRSSAIIIDHADNLMRHGLPDRNINWSLYKDENYENSLLSCVNCGFVFHVSKQKCAECGYKWKLDEEIKRVKTNNGRPRKILLASLIEYKKDIEKKEKIKKIHQIYNSEIQIPQINGSGYMRNVILKLSEWFAYNMEDYALKGLISYRDLNDFMKTNFNNQDFWMSEFTANDTQTTNNEKCLTVYKKYGGIYDKNY